MHTLRSARAKHQRSPGRGVGATRPTRAAIRASLVRHRAGLARAGAHRERAFKTAWARLMAEAMNESVGPPVLPAGMRFTFHDPRAYRVT